MKFTLSIDSTQALSHKTLVMLLGIDPSKNPDQPIPATYPEVTFAYIKHMWKSDQKVWKMLSVSFGKKPLIVFTMLDSFENFLCCFESLIPLKAFYSCNRFRIVNTMLITEKL